MGIHKASKAEINDVLFRIPSNHYFSTWYIEMLIAVAYSLRYERLKNLEFSIKNTWLYEEVANMQESSISEKIKELRTDLKMNQKNFSAAIGIRQPTLSHQFLDGEKAGWMKSYNGRIPACGVFCGGCPIYTREKVPAKEQNRMVLAVKNVKHSIYVAWKKE